MNILAGAVFDRSQHEYMEAYDLSRRSYRDNLKGDWDELFITGDYAKPMIPHGWAQMHKDILQRVRALCGLGRNVLYAEVDTVCVNPTEIFGLYPDMMMFWKTCAQDSRWPYYMNSGVIYFPATVDEKVWEVLNLELDCWNENVWDNFQAVTNAMYWSQEGSYALHPELNWSPHVVSPIRKEDAKILHFHSSRGIDHTLEQMRESLHAMLVSR